MLVLKERPALQQGAIFPANSSFGACAELLFSAGAGPHVETPRNGGEGMGRLVQDALDVVLVTGESESVAAEEFGRWRAQ